MRTLFLLVTLLATPLLTASIESDNTVKLLNKKWDKENENKADFDAFINKFLPQSDSKVTQTTLNFGKSLAKPTSPKIAAPKKSAKGKSKLPSQKNTLNAYFQPIQSDEPQPTQIESIPFKGNPAKKGILAFFNYEAKPVPAVEPIQHIELVPSIEPIEPISAAISPIKHVILTSVTLTKKRWETFFKTLEKMSLESLHITGADKEFKASALDAYLTSKGVDSLKNLELNNVFSSFNASPKKSSDLTSYIANPTLISSIFTGLTSVLAKSIPLWWFSENVSSPEEYSSEGLSLPLENLSLNYTSLSNERNMKDVAEMVALSGLKTLSLSNCSINKTGFKQLLTSLEKCNSLERLDISNNLFINEEEDKNDVSNSIIEFLKLNPNIISINVCNNNPAQRLTIQDPRVTTDNNN